MTGRDVVNREREVVAARAKFMGDIAALQAPGGLVDLPETIRQAAIDKRDDLVADMKDRGHNLLAAVREKAVANPAATLVIGAGLAWHFLRRPPIVAALIGGGVLSLLRTRVGNAPTGTPEDALERARENLRRQAGDLGVRAGGAVRHAVETSHELAEEAKSRAVELAGGLRDRAVDLADDAKRRAASVAGIARERAGEIADTAREVISDTRHGDLSDLARDDGFVPLEGRSPNDGRRGSAPAARPPIRTETVLVGVAGIMLGAAVAALCQRRSE